MPALRYSLAFVAAALIIGGGTAFCAYVRQSLAELMRAEFAKPENAENVATLPPEVRAKLEAGEIPQDVGMVIPSSLMWKIQLTDMLSRYALFLSLIVIGLSFLTAYLLGGRGLTAAV